MMKTLKIQLQSPDHVDKYIRAQESHSPQIIPILRGELLTDPVAGRTDGRNCLRSMKLYAIKKVITTGFYHHATQRSAAPQTCPFRTVCLGWFISGRVNLAAPPPPSPAARCTKWAADWCKVCRRSNWTGQTDWVFVHGWMDGWVAGSVLWTHRGRYVKCLEFIYLYLATTLPSPYFINQLC